MPFGLKNGPSTFQRAMLNVLEGQEEYSTVYIDDILIFSLSWEDHLIHITAILEVLKRHGLTAKPSKCVWGARTLEYLGHIVGDGKVAVPEARVQAIRDFKRPNTKKDMRTFLGTTGYYRKFIKNYGEKSASLTKATRKDAPSMVVWSTEMINDFHNLCNALCSSCVLTIPLCHDQFIVQTDASGKGISGILSVCRNGTELPVAFFSRQLRGAERNYAASELECLAVVEAD